MLSFLIKIRVIVALVILDLLFNQVAITVQRPVYITGVLFGLHLLLIVTQAALLYSLVSNTIMFRAGMFAGVFKIIRFSVLLGVLHLLFLVGTSTIRIRTTAFSKYAAEAWKAWYYWLLLFAQQTISILYYVALCRNCMTLGEGKYFIARSG